MTGKIKLAVRKTRKPLRNEKGMALIETLPILVIFLLLVSFSLGFFGIVHTGILNSIAARTYAFETFQHRADTKLFRDYNAGGNADHYTNFGNRVHAISSEKNIGERLGEMQYGSTRPLAVGRNMPKLDVKDADHNIEIYNIVGRNRKVGVNPAWVMVGYGLCIDANCGD